MNKVCILCGKKCEEFHANTEECEECYNKIEQYYKELEDDPSE